MELEQKKRKLEDNGSPYSTPSKRPLQSLSTDGPLTQSDVVYYKKEAIWRQMNFYKLQALELRSELERYERRYKAFLASHSLVESWYLSVVGSLGHESPKQLNISSVLPNELADLLEDRSHLLIDLLKSNSVAISEETLNKLFDVVKLRAEKIESLQLQVILQEKLVVLETKIEELQIAKDRSESISIKRVQANNKQKTDEAEQVTNGTANGDTSKSIVKDPRIGAEEASTDEQELESLKVEFALMKAGIDSLTESLKAATDKLASAEFKNMELSQKLVDLDEQALMKLAKYVNLLSQNRTLNEANIQFMKLKEELVARLSALEEKQGLLANSVNADILEENNHLKELLSKAETDLTRVRTVRDELIGKQAILRLELEQSKPSSEVVALSETLNQRLLKLEETLAAEFTVEADSNLEDIEKPELVKRLQILSGELLDLESAFQETRSLALDKLKDHSEKEGLVKKLMVEKTKADQKYFASMRVKDLLAAENKILKSQISKSQELILKHGEIEKTFIAKIDVLNKSLAELCAIKENSIRENSKLYESVKSLTRSREGAAKEIAQLKQDLGAIAKEKETLTEDLSDVKYTLGKLQGKLKATESLLQKYKSNNTSSILQEDEKQLEALRSITKCSVCLKNWKNTAITACGHVFCDGCVQERLNARLRRCPTCNKGFSSNDLLLVHL